MLTRSSFYSLSRSARLPMSNQFVRPISSPAMLKNVHAVSQQSFTANHELYDAVRSGYPVDAMRCAASKRVGHDVLEVAAGTGKFTAALLPFLPPSVRITAVEPSSGMLETFRRKFPTIPSVQASSAQLPFEDASFDTVYVAQAFHWFANRESLAEFRRVLRPNGSLVLVWNYENTATMDPNGWQARTTELVHSYDNGVPQYRHMSWVKTLSDNGDLFEPWRERKWAYDLPVESPEFYWRYWASRSYITALSPEEQGELKAKLLKILDEYKDEPLVAKRGTHIVWTHPTKTDSPAAN